MDPSQSTSFTDLPSGEVQLRSTLYKLQEAFFSPDYAMAASQKLKVLPILLEQLSSLYRIVQGQLSGLADVPRNKWKRKILSELRANINDTRRAATDVLAAASVSDQTRTARESQAQIQTHADLQQERGVAGPWEGELISKLEAITDILPKVNRALS